MKVKYLWLAQFADCTLDPILFGFHAVHNIHASNHTHSSDD